MSLPSMFQPYIYLSIYLFVYLSIYLSIYLSTYIYMYMYIYIYICIYIYIYMYACVYVCKAVARLAIAAFEIQLWQYFSLPTKNFDFSRLQLSSNEVLHYSPLGCCRPESPSLTGTCD